MEKREAECDETQQDQINCWLQQLSTPLTAYREPKLEESTIEVVKTICDMLQQTTEVFIASVDVLEEYVQAKKRQQHKICNSLLVIASCILLTSKLTGSYPEVKIATMHAMMKKLIRTNTHTKEIKATELDILVTLGKLPLNNIVTDLSMFLIYYVKNLKLQADIQPLCWEILNIIYICRKKMFRQLKSVYSQTAEALQVFQHLICNKMYFPSGIVLCALKLTKYRRFLNLEQVTQDIENIAEIHSDHLEHLAGIIYELMDV